MDKLYRKVGKRYKEIGHEFAGFPSDGIWLVQNGKQSQMCLIGLKEDVPFNALEYRIHADELSLHLVRNLLRGHLGLMLQWLAVISLVER